MAWVAGKKLARVPAKSLFMAKRLASSSPQDLVVVQPDSSSGFLTLALNRAPVNSMNLEFMSELSAQLAKAEKDKSVRGIILTSNQKVFSAGLDLAEFCHPDDNRLKAFWTAFQDVWLSLYGCKKPIATAINGQAPAGGCAMAICTDFRAMVGKGNVIGLNESKFGLVAPLWLMDTYRATIGNRRAEMGMITGDLYPAEKALQLGIIDELAESKEDAVAKCVAYLTAVNQNVRLESTVMTKLQMRGDLLKKFHDGRKKDLEVFFTFIRHPEMQKAMSGYLESLKSKKK